MFVTRLGHRAAESGLAEVHAANRLSVDLHPRLKEKVRRQFLMGEYEIAALAAMREVEIHVREMAHEAFLVGNNEVVAALEDRGEGNDGGASTEQVERVEGRFVLATVRGDTAIYEVRHEAGAWLCPCESRKNCSHAPAVMLVTAPVRLGRAS